MQVAAEGPHCPTGNWYTPVGAPYPLDSRRPTLTHTLVSPLTQSSCELSHTKEENSINLRLMRTTKEEEGGGGGDAEMEKKLNGNSIHGTMTRHLWFKAAVKGTTSPLQSINLTGLFFFLSAVLTAAHIFQFYWSQLQAGPV